MIYLRNRIHWFFYLAILVVFSCAEEIIPEDKVPQINCIDHELVNNWSMDTLVTGYQFSVPPSLTRVDNQGINIVYESEGIGENRIRLTFGTCGGPIDPCVPAPYNASYSIDPPTADTIQLRFTEAWKTIEVCDGSVLHGVLYIRDHDKNFNVFNGMFFTLIPDEDIYYLGGDFYFGKNHMDDIIKICKSFTPL